MMSREISDWLFSDEWRYQRALNYLSKSLGAYPGKIKGIYYGASSHNVCISLNTREIEFSAEGMSIVTMLAAVIERIQIELETVSKSDTNPPTPNFSGVFAYSEILTIEPETAKSKS